MNKYNQISKLREDAEFFEYRKNDGSLDIWWEFENIGDDIIIPQFGSASLPTGLSIFTPENFIFEICDPFSEGAELPRGVTASNVISHEYRGELRITVYNNNNFSITIKHKQRIGSGIQKRIEHKF